MTMKRRHGTIDRHGDRWRIRFRLPTGERRALYTEPGASEHDAEALLEAALRELAGTSYDPRSSGVSLGAWGARWLDAREETHRDAQGDRQRWRQHVASAPIASVRLSVLAPDHVRTWLDALATGAHARQTIRNAYTTLRACLRAAERAHAITAPRLRDLLSVPMPALRHEASVDLDERIAYLTDAQIASVLALDLTREQLSAFVVGCFAGLRAGELHGLAWERVRLDDVRPHLVIARSRSGGTKNGKAARVPLLEPARLALHARWVDAGRPASGLVWPGDDGGTHARGYDWGWADHRERREGVLHVRPGIASRAGIKRIAWKDATRHTCGVHLLRGTWSPDFVPAPYRLEEVSRFLRHSSLAVTERHYAHLSLDSLPVVDPGRGSSGSREADEASEVPVFLSHTADLNCGPTVYETVAPANDSADLGDAWTHAGPAGERMRRLAAQYLRQVALGSPSVDAGTALAVAVLDAERAAAASTSAAVVATRARLVSVASTKETKR